MLILINVAKKGEIIDRKVFNLIKFKLFELKKVKMTKSKFLTKLKNYANFFKYQSIDINISVIKISIFKAKIVFTWLK